MHFFAKQSCNYRIRHSAVEKQFSYGFCIINFECDEEEKQQQRRTSFDSDAQLMIVSIEVYIFNKQIICFRLKALKTNTCNRQNIRPYASSRRGRGRGRRRRIDWFVNGSNKKSAILSTD